MPRIIQLPPGLINKIAAGEVIERPASVVKELMENSVDAGATRIDVTMEKGGSELLRIADNGCGIAAGELPLAIASHATSKIQTVDDLFSVRTLGFRGEALASIGEVSRMLIRSRTADAAAGAELEVVGGQAGPVAPAGCPVGTTIEIRQLFFNTPVRRRFLRTTPTEMGHVTEAFTRIALAHPEIQFSLRHNERTIHDLPAVDSWRERILAFFGDELTDMLIRVASQDQGNRLQGYVADPSVSRANNRMQYLFLNGRHIRDRSLQHALSEAYRGLLLTGRSPVAFLRLNVPVEEVDVNVHPTKLEVRFQDGGRLYNQVLSTIRNRFLTTDLTTRVRDAQATATSSASPPGPALLPDRSSSTTGGDQRFEREHQEQMLQWARRGPADSAPGAESPGDTAFSLSSPTGQQQPRLPMDYVGPSRVPPPVSSQVPPFRPFTTDGPPAPPPGMGQRQTPAQSSARPPATSATRLAPPASSPHGLQLHNRYLVAETEQGMIVIDQHALHERILYEQLREKVLSGTLETQRLLVPEPVTLSPAEAATALEAAQCLAQLGIHLEPFGGDTVAITSFPAMLAKVSPSEMLRQLVQQWAESGQTPDRRDVLDELLHMMSCKAAIKAGDRLSPEEINALLEQRQLCQDAHHCPHGRPTALEFTREELDRRFKRI